MVHTLLQLWPHFPSRPWFDPQRCWLGGWHVVVAPALHSPLVSARLAQRPDTPGIHLGRVQKKNKELESIRFQMVLPPGQMLCYKALSLLPVPSWAVLLLSRSVMISAWMSLILLRSAARLYSICSICVWGITCLSCTCAHTHQTLLNQLS